MKFGRVSLAARLKIPILETRHLNLARNVEYIDILVVLHSLLQERDYVVLHLGYHGFLPLPFPVYCLPINLTLEVLYCVVPDCVSVQP
jgi:hypothetical protein